MGYCDRYNPPKIDLTGKYFSMTEDPLDSRTPAHVWCVVSHDNMDTIIAERVSGTEQITARVSGWWVRRGMKTAEARLMAKNAKENAKVAKEMHFNRFQDAVLNAVNEYHKSTDRNAMKVLRKDIRCIYDVFEVGAEKQKEV